MIIRGHDLFFWKTGLWRIKIASKPRVKNDERARKWDWDFLHTFFVFWTLSLRHFSPVTKKQSWLLYSRSAIRYARDKTGPSVGSPFTGIHGKTTKTTCNLLPCPFFKQKWYKTRICEISDLAFAGSVVSSPISSEHSKLFRDYEGTLNSEEANRALWEKYTVICIIHLHMPAFFTGMI